MKKLSAILASLILFAGVSFANPVVKQQKATTKKKEVKKTEKKEKGVKKVPAKNSSMKKTEKSSKKDTK